MFKKIKTGLRILKEKGLKEFIFAVFIFLNNHSKRIIEILLYPYIIFKIKKFKLKNLDELYNFISNSFLSLLRPMQIKEEFIELLKIFQEKDPKYILEIGTASGGTLFCFCKLARQDAVIISIDLPEGQFGGGYPKWRATIYQSFTKENQKLYLLRKDSHQQETLEEVQKILGEHKIDFLFIDGDHSYDGVKKDFKTYLPLVKKGGIVAFHDIAILGDEEFVGNVPQVWQEIKNGFKFKEIIKNKEQKGWGIGLVYN